MKGNFLDHFLPESKRQEHFSRKALWILTSTPGVTCVLNGIRKPAYVEDSLTVLQWDPIVETTSILQSLRET